jgi:hypothetical protein
MAGYDMSDLAPVTTATLIWTSLILCLVNVLRRGDLIDAFMSGLVCYSLISYTKDSLDVKFWERFL